MRRLDKILTSIALATAATLSSGCDSKMEEKSAPIDINMTIDADSFVPRLAESLGYFSEQGLNVKEVNILDYSEKDYLVQQPLRDGRIHLAYHWAQHSVFGAQQGLPVKAVMNVVEAPGMSILVNTRKVDEIKSAADFAGRNVAEGAGYATKAMLMNYFTHKAGLPQHSYTPVASKLAGREEAVRDGLLAGEIDIAAFMEPLSSRLLESGNATVLYDISTREATEALFGATIPADSLLVSDEMIKNNPQAVQKIVNAFAKTVDFINTNDADAIYEALPKSYKDRKSKAEEVELISLVKPGFNKSGYGFRKHDVSLLVDMIDNFDFDDSEPGKWRRGPRTGSVDVLALYDNQFVEALGK